MELAPRLLYVSLFVGALGCGPDVLEPREPTPGVPHFTIATYNVLNLMSGDPATLSAVGETKADIICLQEITSAWRNVLRERYSAEYPYMLFHTSEGSAGLGVLSRYPMTEAELEEAPNKAWHPAWRLSVETPAGWLQLLHVHLRANFSEAGSAANAYLHVKQDHLLEIEDFNAACSKAVPTIILGDFNEPPDGAALTYLESMGYQNVLPLYRPGQFTWRHASLGGQLNETIDHILFDESVVPLRASVLMRGNSDHLPVVAQFEEAQDWPKMDLVATVSEALPRDGSSSEATRLESQVSD